MAITDDLRHSFRQLRAAPAWSAVLVAVLGAGMALTVAAFLLIDAVLFRPIGIEAQERVVRIGRTGETRAWMNSNSWPMVEVLTRADDVFTGTTAEGWLDPRHYRLPDGTRERVRGRAVAGNYFDVLGVPMAHGRGFLARDDHAAAEPVAIVADRFWRRHLQGDPAAVGRRITLNDTSYEIVGITPPAFRGMDVESLDVWLPARQAMRPASLWTDPGYNSFEIFARLRPGVTLAQADAAVDALASAVRTGDGSDHAMAVPVSRFGNLLRDTSEVRGAMLLGAGAAAMLLLACVNAAGLLLVRAERRRGELALRAALGGSRARLMWQQWLDAAVPVALACGVGLVLGVLAARFAVDVAGARGVLGVAIEDLAPAPRTLALVGAALLACSLVCALPAMLGVARTRLAREVAGGFGSGARGGRRWHGARTLVVLQFALTVAVAGVGALFVDRFVAQWRAPVGEIREDVLTLAVEHPVAPDADEPDLAAIDAHNRRLLDDVLASGLVAEAGLAAMVPISGNSMTRSILVGGAERDLRETQGFYNPVTPGVFAALGLRAVDGRLFDARDTATSPRVMLVSRTAAERLWPGRSPVGESVGWPAFGDAPEAPATIVGVVEDVRYQTQAPGNTYYVPIEQRGFDAGMSTVVALPAAAANRAAVAQALRAAAQRAAPEQAPGEVASVGERIDAALAGPRFIATLALAFGSLAVLLAATGIYGAFAFLVTARQRELGIRLAIGATPQALHRLVLGDALLVIGAGIVLGLLATAALSAIARHLAWALPALDATTLAIILAAICVAGLAAVLPAARRAARIAPQDCLRSA